MLRVVFKANVAATASRTYRSSPLAFVARFFVREKGCAARFVAREDTSQEPTTAGEEIVFEPIEMDKQGPVPAAPQTSESKGVEEEEEEEEVRDVPFLPARGLVALIYGLCCVRSSMHSQRLQHKERLLAGFAIPPCVVRP